MEPVSEVAGEPPGNQEADQEERGNAFEVRSRRRKGKKGVPGAHELAFTVTCALALNSTQPAHYGAANGFDGSNMAGDSESTTGQTGRGGGGGPEAPKAYGYYHLEHKLFPDDAEPMRTDIVNYGVAARVYPERSDSRTIKTWGGSSGSEQVWVAWSQSVKVPITKELLQTVAAHELVLRLWDTKEKCSSRCRWDTKPKAFRFPPPKPGQDPENVGGVKSCVLRLSKSFQHHLGSRIVPERPLPHHQTTASILRTQNPQAAAQGSASDQPEKRKEASQEPSYSVYAVPKAEREPNARSYSRLQRLAATDVEPEKRKSRQGSRVRTAEGQGEGDKKNVPASEMAPAEAPGGEKPGPAEGGEPARVSRPRRGKKAMDEEARRFERDGRCSVSLSLAGLFIGQSVTARLSSPVASVEDLFISVSINGPLLSENQRKELNPLVVRIRGTDCMPERPLSFSQLRESCEEAFVRYRFMDQPFYQTPGRPQGQKIEWNDVKVFLTGLYEPGILREYLGGSGMELEVHDRDRRPIEEKLPPALFGDDLEDEKISNIGIVTSKRTAHSAFGSTLRPWDPYGVCRLDLTGLLDGHKLLCFTLPILPCTTPDLIRGDVDSDNRVVGTAGAVDGPSQTPLPAGHYLESGATLKVTIELSLSLNQTSSQSAKCPFGRLVFDIAQSRLFFVRKIIRLVKQVNAIAFGLDHLPPHVISNALLNYHLTEEQRQQPDLNFLSGFHLMDGSRHLIVLEGPRGHSIRKLWTSLGVEASECPSDRVLYNDALSFSSRLYADLDLDMMKVKLSEPLNEVVRRPLLYVRDMVPKLCFEGVKKLNDLAQARTMQAVVRNELFPTGEMFRAVSRELGVPFTVMDLQRLEAASPDIPEASVTQAKTETSFGVCDRKQRVPIDNFNAEHLRNIADRRDRPQTHNFVMENRRQVSTASRIVASKRATSCPSVRLTAETGLVAHNYSTQRLNSSELAKRKIREVCRDDKLYSYAPQFHHSGALERDSLTEALQREELSSRQRWRTTKGWVLPGHKVSLEANRHPMRPDNARCDDLREKWLENGYHAAALKPTVPAREAFTWKHRKQDLDLWTRAPPSFGQEPFSIMAPGALQHRELQEHAEEEARRWAENMVVADTQFHCHRQLAATESTERGHKSSNQIDRLSGLLKDRPIKYGLLFPGYRDVPPLGVVHDPKDERGAYEPGDSFAGSLSRNFLPKQPHSSPVTTCDKQPLYFRRIQGLEVEERENNLFSMNGTLVHPMDAVRFQTSADPEPA